MYVETARGYHILLVVGSYVDGSTYGALRCNEYIRTRACNVARIMSHSLQRYELSIRGILHGRKEGRHDDTDATVLPAHKRIDECRSMYSYMSMNSTHLYFVTHFFIHSVGRTIFV